MIIAQIWRREEYSKLNFNISKNASFNNSNWFINLFVTIPPWTREYTFICSGMKYELFLTNELQTNKLRTQKKYIWSCSQYIYIQGLHIDLIKYLRIKYAMMINSEWNWLLLITNVHIAQRTVSLAQFNCHYHHLHQMGPCICFNCSLGKLLLLTYVFHG